VQLTKRTISTSVYPGATKSSELSAFATLPNRTNSSPAGTSGAGANLTMSSIEAIGVHVRFEAGGEVAKVSIISTVAALATGAVIARAPGVIVQVHSPYTYPAWFGQSVF
jgi:hypothetical protein